jgi:nucleotide-binding universal stress UspA family protein
MRMTSVFDTVLCAVDRSDESLDAARQAARLASPGGRLRLVSAIELDVAAQAGWAAASVASELEGDARVALDRACEAIADLHPCETQLVEGPAEPGILTQAAEDGATLICLGTHGHSRFAGILIGSLTTTLLHDATCSVLVARHVGDESAFPRSIVVGVDGSEEADRALAVAAELSDRFGSTVREIIGTKGKNVDVDVVREARPAIEAVGTKPVDALVEASKEADLLVIGSSGKHGVRALGSVSERVAHQARCSVLIVRAV